MDGIVLLITRHAKGAGRTSSSSSERAPSAMPLRCSRHVVCRRGSPGFRPTAAGYSPVRLTALWSHWPPGKWHLHTQTASVAKGSVSRCSTDDPNNQVLVLAARQLPPAERAFNKDTSTQRQGKVQQWRPCRQSSRAGRSRVRIVPSCRRRGHVRLLLLPGRVGEPQRGRIQLSHHLRLVVVRMRHQLRTQTRS